MLAYELFLKNKDWDEEFGNPINIKKVYVKAVDSESLTIVFDDKTLQEYGENRDSIELLKNLLQMPSRTLKSVGLPFRGTSSNSPRAYVEFYGMLKKNTLEIYVKGRYAENKTIWKYSFDFAKDEEEINISSDFIRLRLDRENYFVKNTLVYNWYVQDGIINSNSEMPKKVFVDVCRKFIDECRAKGIVAKIADYKSSEIFQLVILPYEIIGLSVKYREVEENMSSGTFIDAFGVHASTYPSRSTQTAKFLSYDDPAFTVNCTSNQDFYKNLGIGNVSFEKINMPPDVSTKISGLNWYFFDITDPTMFFENKQSGFYDNLISAYSSLENKRYASPQTVAMLKILCVKKSQAKLEVLIDENLTFSQLKKILSRGGLAYCPMVFETLIKKKNQDIVWSDYINAIRFYLNDLFFERNALVKRYAQDIRERLFDWIRETNLRDSSFFEKSGFLIKLLTKEGEKMDLNEEYAYKIGRIAGKYVNIKKAADEAGSSTIDILTYTKYDRERLRYAYRRVCLGAALIKDPKKADELNQFIKLNTPSTEIDDTKAGEDYSYWFYKGVFETL